MKDLKAEDARGTVTHAAACIDSAGLITLLDPDEVLAYLHAAGAAIHFRRNWRPHGSNDLAGPGLHPVIVDLARGLAYHQHWCESSGAEGEWLSLIGEDLGGVDLSDCNLHGAYIRPANLDGACLSGSDGRSPRGLSIDRRDQFLVRRS